MGFIVPLSSKNGVKKTHYVSIESLYYVYFYFVIDMFAKRINVIKKLNNSTVCTGRFIPKQLEIYKGEGFVQQWTFYS